MIYEVKVTEMRAVCCIYQVEAENPRRAARMAERGETSAETASAEYEVVDRYVEGAAEPIGGQEGTPFYPEPVSDLAPQGEELAHV